MSAITDALKRAMEITKKKVKEKKPSYKISSSSKGSSKKGSSKTRTAASKSSLDEEEEKKRRKTPTLASFLSQYGQAVAKQTEEGADSILDESKRWSRKQQGEPEYTPKELTQIRRDIKRSDLPKEEKSKYIRDVVKYTEDVRKDAESRKRSLQGTLSGISSGGGGRSWGDEEQRRPMIPTSLREFTKPEGVSVQELEEEQRRQFQTAWEDPMQGLKEGFSRESLTGGAKGLGQTASGIAQFLPTAIPYDIYRKLAVKKTLFESAGEKLREVSRATSPREGLAIEQAQYADVPFGIGAVDDVSKLITKATTRKAAIKVLTKDLGIKTEQLTEDLIAKVINTTGDDAGKLASELTGKVGALRGGANIDDINREIQYMVGDRVPDVDEIMEAGIRNAQNKGKNLQYMFEEAITTGKKDKGFFRTVTDFLYPMENQTPEVKEVVGKYLSKKLAAREITNEFVNGLPDIGWDELMAYQRGEANPEVKKVFDGLIKEAEAAGWDMRYLQQYLPQVYRNSSDEIINAVSRYMRDMGVPEETIQAYIHNKAQLQGELANKLGINPTFTQNRLFPSYDVAKQYGLTPKYNNLKQLAGHYKSKIESTKVNIEFIDDMINRGLLKTESGGPDWITVNTPQGAGGYYAPKEFASLLNGMFEDINSMGGAQKATAKFFKGLAKLNKATQELVLSGGIPKTNVNFWTFGQAVKHVTTAIGEGGLALPLKTIKGIVTEGSLRPGMESVHAVGSDIKQLGNIIRSNFTGRSIKWFKGKQGIIKMMADEGIDVGYRVGQFDEVGRGFGKHFTQNTAKQFAGNSFDKLFNEKTFQSFAPMQTITVFEDSYKSALRSGMDDVAARGLAAEVTRKFQGLINAPGRSKMSEDIMSGLLFAPRFRESIVNVLGNTFLSIMPAWKKGGKWISPLTDPAFTKNRSLLAGMALTYYGYDRLNRSFNDGKSLRDNPPGKELNLMIPATKLPKGLREKIRMSDEAVVYIPFMPSFSALPRNIYEGISAFAKGDWQTGGQKIGSLASIPVKTITEAATNKDFFGREIYDPYEPTLDKFADGLKYVGENMFAHPFVKLAINEVKRSMNKNEIEKFGYLLDLDNAEDPTAFREAMDKLSANERQEYYDFKYKKIKPKYQALMEASEFPVYFSSKGSIRKQKMYADRDDFLRAFKKEDDTEIQKRMLQQYFADLPSDEDRQSFSNWLDDRHISIRGIKISETTIKAMQLNEEYRGSSDEEFFAKVEELSNGDETEQQIAENMRKYRSDDVAKELGIETTNDFSSLSIEEKANAIEDRLNPLPEDDKVNILGEMVRRDVISNDLMKEIGKRRLVPVERVISMDITSGTKAMMLYGKLKEETNNFYEGDPDRKEKMNEVGSRTDQMLLTEIDKLQMSDREKKSHYEAITRGLKDYKLDDKAREEGLTSGDERWSQMEINDKADIIVKKFATMEVGTEGETWERYIERGILGEDAARENLEEELGYRWKKWQEEHIDESLKREDDKEALINEGMRIAQMELNGENLTEEQERIYARAVAVAPIEEVMAEMGSMGSSDIVLAGNWGSTGGELQYGEVNIPMRIQPNGQPSIAYRHNNPGNLHFANQLGATKGDPIYKDGKIVGYWAKFETAGMGAEALKRQIQLDASRGQTIREFVYKYAPPKENNTEGYIQEFVNELGTTADTKLEDLDINAALAFVANKESGTTFGTPYYIDESGMRLAQAVQSGSMTPAEAVQAMIDQPMGQPPVTQIPTSQTQTQQPTLASLPEESRTSQWLASQQYGTQTMGIFYLLKMLKGLYGGTAKAGKYRGIPTLT